MIKQYRWSNLTLNSSFTPSNIVGEEMMETGSGTACQCVDEFVIDPSRGTVATLEAPPSFSILFAKDVNCSHPAPTGTCF